MLLPSVVTLPTTLRRHSRVDAGHSRARSIASIVAFAVIATGLRSLRRVEVTGNSMSPALLPGDHLVVIAPPFGPIPWPTPGQIVAVRDPRRTNRILIKRVRAVHPDAGTVEVVGDDRTASTDSRTFGAVPRTSVLGRAVYRYAPSSRRGPIAPTGEYHRA